MLVIKRQRHSHLSLRRVAGKIAIKAMTFFLLALVIFPILWLIACSFKTPAELIREPVYRLPSGFYWQNYVDAWVKGKMNIFYRNSVITTFVSLAFTVSFSSMVAFALCKLRWKLSGIFKLLFSFGIVVPVQMVLIPLFVSAFRRAYELATAMECRCYQGGTGRTRMKSLHFGRVDFVSLLVCLIILAGVILCNVFLPAAVR